MNFDIDSSEGDFAAFDILPQQDEVLLIVLHVQFEFTKAWWQCHFKTSHFNPESQVQWVFRPVLRVMVTVEEVAVCLEVILMSKLCDVVAIGKLLVLVSNDFLLI